MICAMHGRLVKLSIGPQFATATYEDGYWVANRHELFTAEVGFPDAGKLIQFPITVDIPPAAGV